VSPAAKVSRPAARAGQWAEAEQALVEARDCIEIPHRQGDGRGEEGG
jgi:cellobiose-specific phosphotransferase system component IIA